MKLIVHPSRSEWPALLARPSRSTGEMIEVVRPIFEAVRTGGDRAIRDLTQQFDGVWIEDLQVADDLIQSSTDAVTDGLARAVEVAAANIDEFHRAQVIEEPVVETMPGVRCWRRRLPIRRVGLYVPGGTAPLLSTALMLAIPARIAGCDEVALCSPPGPDGLLDPGLLYAARAAGVHKVFRVGGAQAIAALTYGTETVPGVDKILGPGNQYVTAAKQFAALQGVAIDLPAGPTEVTIVADESCPVDFVVLDILAQAEHGPDSHILLVTTSESYALGVMSAVGEVVKSIPRHDIAEQALENSVCVVVSSESEALDLCNEYAPEHLILATADPGGLVALVRAAGSVFVGRMSPEAAGDYASGTNHTLPTGGAARAYSGVSVDSFVNKVTFQEISETGIRNLAPTVVTLAAAEGLEAHSRSVSVRLEALGI